MTDLVIETPRVFHPLLRPMRYKGAWGGRGSGKSHHFAGAGVESCLMQPGFRWVCVREVQKDLKESAKQLIEDKIQALGVGSLFDVKRDVIKTPGDGMIIFRGMQDYNAEGIKSLEAFDLAWLEEAQTISDRSWELLRPTIRKPGSEIWASWNPRSAKDPVDRFFRGPNPHPEAALVKSNYLDNPFFPDELERERLYDKVANPERYGHIWLGDYEPVAKGALWTRVMLHEGRKDEAPTLKRIAIGVDHAISAEEGANEHGIIVAGLGVDGRGYVLDDCSMTGQPYEWAERAIAAYDYYEADTIVIERNQGGDLVARNLRAIRPEIHITEVHASRGKHVRAAPVASLYALGRVSHVGVFPELEDQMCLMTSAGYAIKDDSPDRLDALVWVMSELFPRIITREMPQRPQGQQGGGLRWRRAG